MARQALALIVGQCPGKTDQELSSGIRLQKCDILIESEKMPTAYRINIEENLPLQ